MAFKGFVILYVLLYFGSFHNEAMVKGNNLNDLNSELPPIKNILVFSIICLSIVLLVQIIFII